MKKLTYILASLPIALCFNALGAHAEDGKYYTPTLDIIAKPGTERSLGVLNMMVPLSQTKDNMLFLDLRTVLDNRDNSEGNVGIGYRKVVNVGGDDYLWGGYGFYDRRRSEYDNYFSQMTLGTELLGTQWRGRFNYYEPFDDQEQIAIDGESFGTFTTDGFVSVDPNTTVEGALRGVDLELGKKMPFGQDTWAHAGVYHFGIGNSVNLNGGRFRAHTDLTDRVRIGIENSYDNIRGANHFAEIRYRLPLWQSDQTRERMLAAKNTVHHYMMEPIVRDIDIVANNRRLRKALAKSGGSNERYYFVDNSVATSGNGTPNRPFKTLAEAEAAVGADNTIVVRQGDGTTANMDGGITIDKDNVRLLGTGIKIRTREGVRIETANGAPSITNTSGDAVYVMADGVEVAGFYIDAPAADGVFVFNYTDANIHDNEIVGAGNNGINLAYTNADNFTATVSDNILTANDRKGIYVRSYNGADVVMRVEDNIANSNVQEGIRYETAGTGASLNVTSPRNTTNDNGSTAGLFGVAAGSSDLTVLVNRHEANENDAHGIFFQLGGSGTHDIDVRNSNVDLNDQKGVSVDVQDSAVANFFIRDSSSTNNLDDGIALTSRSSGVLDARVRRVSVSGNAGQGVDITSNNASRR